MLLCLKELAYNVRGEEPTSYSGVLVSLFQQRMLR